MVALMHDTTPPRASTGGPPRARDPLTSSKPVPYDLAILSLFLAALQEI
jgi:hypothetical protein